MATKETPFIGGHSLRFNWDNLELLSDTLGLETFQEFGHFFINAEKQLGMKTIKNLVWCGLQRPDKSFDKKEVGSIIDEFLENRTLSDLIEVVITSLGEAWGKQEGEAKGEIPKKPPKPLKN